jgi:hypothetical protein
MPSQERRQNLCVTPYGVDPKPPVGINTVDDLHLGLPLSPGTRCKILFSLYDSRAQPAPIQPDGSRVDEALLLPLQRGGPAAAPDPHVIEPASGS